WVDTMWAGWEPFVFSWGLRGAMWDEQERVPSDDHRHGAAKDRRLAARVRRAKGRAARQTGDEGGAPALRSSPVRFFAQAHRLSPRRVHGPGPVGHVGPGRFRQSRGHRELLP